MELKWFKWGWDKSECEYEFNLIKNKFEKKCWKKIKRHKKNFGLENNANYNKIIVLCGVKIKNYL